MRIVAAGASGFIGTALLSRLRADGHDVMRLVRRPTSAPDELTWSPSEGALDTRVLAGVGAVVNLAGAGVGDHRWTTSYKREIQRSRVDATTTICHAMAALPEADRPGVLLNASAIGFYGDRGTETLTEDSPAGDGFLPDVCRAWESATATAEDAGVRVCHLRTGLVLGKGAGILGRVVPLFRAGVGGKLGNGRQIMSWISLADEIGAIVFLLDPDLVHNVAGAVNLTGPAPISNAEFTRTLGDIVDRPTLLPVPSFGLRIALGEFAADVLASARVLPVALQNAGFRHEHADVTSALRWALGR